MSFANKARKIIAEMKKDNSEKRAIEICPMPYLDLDGSLVIPFACDGRFHYWNGGQTIRDTVGEIRGWKH